VAIIDRIGLKVRPQNRKKGKNEEKETK